LPKKAAQRCVNSQRKDNALGQAHSPVLCQNGKSRA
jgi:hypothetical protein